jgi:hypothetical protein
MNTTSLFTGILFLFGALHPEYRVELTVLQSILFIAGSILMVLLVEGLIFFAFRYREKTSWSAFFIINLITHGLGYFLLVNVIIINTTTWVLGLSLTSLGILLVEIIAFTLALKEHKKGRAALYVLTATIASLLCGLTSAFLLPA